MKPLDLESADDVIKTAEKIRRIMNPKDFSSGNIPKVLEIEVENSNLIQFIKTSSHHRYASHSIP
jgi:hypothetical protein